MDIKKFYEEEGVEGESLQDFTNRFVWEIKMERSRFADGRKKFVEPVKEEVKPEVKEPVKEEAVEPVKEEIKEEVKEEVKPIKKVVKKKK